MRKIRDLMTEQVAFVTPDTLVTEAAQLMQKHNIGVLPVCEGQNVVGILTDRDIVVRNVAHQQDPSVTPVRNIMTTQVESVSPDTTLNRAAEIMAEKQVRRLPVLENNQLVGIVSLGDLATQAKYDVELARTLGEISVPSRPRKM